VFNAPPGWPQSPPGWQPAPGWQPDPSWPAAPPGWEFWLPAPQAGQQSGQAGQQSGPQTGQQAGQDAGQPIEQSADSNPMGPTGNPMGPTGNPMGPTGNPMGPTGNPMGPTGNPMGPTGELHLQIDGQSYAFQPGELVRIGRAPDNDVEVGEPTVSRQHARMVWADGGWIFESSGHAATLLHGQPVTRLAVTQPVDLTLGSAQGPVLRIEVRSAPGSWAAAAPAGPSYQGDHGHGHAHAALTVEGEMAEAIHILFPVRSWLHLSPWRQGLRLLVIVYALLPLVFLALFANSQSLTTPGWAYSLYIAPLWAIGFWLLVRPGHIKALEIEVGIGIIVWVLVWMNVVTVNINGSLHQSGQSFSLLAALGIGYNEEITKALPILIAGLVLRKYRSTKLDVRMWMFLGTIAGLTFGVFEQAFYTSQDILLINQARVSSQAVEAVLAFAERVFVDGFQHAVWAGISAFFIGMAVNYRRRRVLLVVVGVSVPAVLHALNDWSQGAFDSLWPSIIIQAVSLLLFLGYTISATSIESQVRETPLFRGESVIMEAFQRPKKTNTP
jgi:RsiW-degrading membrane proteinase PrsW (M82 family)